MMAMHPHPVPCRNCGIILQATYAEQNEFRCPQCGELVCYVCGCTERSACVVEIHNGDKTSTTAWICEWANVPGTCSHCYSRAAYELYQEANGEPADDPFYMSLGRSAFGVKGLDYAV
jgi:predicted RNA-binding Zn-ribbon protein involved in translation (DUF1610 family)